MEIKIKWVAIVEFFAIVLLLGFLVYSASKNPNANETNANGLLSPRIYAELLEPKSFLIVKFTPLIEKINSYADERHINASIYIKNLRNGASAGINANTGFFPASLTKIPLSILVMEKIENKELSLNTILPVLDSDRDKSSGTLYKSNKKELDIKTLLTKLLKESDNTAFNVLSRYIESKNMGLLMDYFDVDVYPEQSYKEQRYQKHELSVSPRLMSNIFSSLYFSTLLEPQDSEFLLNLMIDTVFDVETAANLPKGAVISQKYGAYFADNARLFHSCGILYIGKSRIFYCVMTKDLSEPEAAKFIGFVVNQTYNYVIDERAKLDVYKNEGTFK